MTIVILSFKTYTIIFAVLSLFFVSVLSIPAIFGTSSSAGVLVPLYVSPNPGAWDPVTDAKGNHTKVPIVAIINPASGPDPSCLQTPNTDYINGITKLHSKGIAVLGYVWTGYAGDDGSNYATDFTNAKNDINTWNSCYPNINGIFFDGMSYGVNDNNQTGFYSQLTYDAKHLNQNFTLIVGNPGTESRPDYINTVDNIVIYEETGMPSTARLQGSPGLWHTQYDKKNFSILPFTVTNMPSNSTIGTDSNFLSYMYITNDIGPVNPNDTDDPWDTVSTHLMNLTKALDKSSALLTIDSKNFTGSPITGSNNINITANNLLVRSGFSTLVYNATTNTPYTIIALNFGNYIFDHWDGFSNHTTAQTVIPTQSTTYTAYYNLTSVSPSSSLGHKFVEQTTDQTRTTNSYADISGASIADADLVDGKKYLLVFTAEVSHNDANQDGYIRAVHGSTAFEGSELAFEPSFGGAESRYNYSWFTVWNATAGEAVKLQFKTEAASGDTVGADQITITAIKLSDDLTENTDWFFNQQTTDTTLASSYGTGNSASVTFTPSGSNNWLVLATAQLDPTSITVPQKTRITASGGVTDTGVEWLQEGKNATNDRMVQTLAKVYTPTSTSTTFTANSESSSGTGSRLYNSVFALNLSKMKNNVFQATASGVSIDTTDNFSTSTNVATTTITPSVAGDTWCLGYGISSSTGQDYIRTRMQADNSDQPPTQTSDFYATPDATWDTTDKYGYAMQTIENFTAASHTLDVDSTTGLLQTGVTVEDRLAMCTTMKLAP